MNKSNAVKNKLSAEERKKFIGILKTRFEKNNQRHKGIDWKNVQAKLEASPGKLCSLYEMERTGGEPDVVEFDKKTNTYIFFDCSPESPKERRSLCYDDEALEKRKEFKPDGSAIGMARSMGITILTEEQYQKLQQLGKFDTKTSSWLLTPAKIRSLGGSIFGDRRYDHVFIYHNGAESYYAARGFRGSLEL